jgi:hypothetical protein
MSGASPFPSFGILEINFVEGPSYDFGSVPEIKHNVE